MAELEIEVVDEIPRISRGEVRFEKLWESVVADGTVKVKVPHGEKPHNFANKLRGDADKLSETYRIAVRKDEIYVQQVSDSPAAEEPAKKSSKKKVTRKRTK